jgi:tRNA1(Val) A37 N6-methylase TrmN6
MPPDIAPDLTDDQFLGGALSVLQPAKGYRSGLDAVLVAAATAAAPGQRVLDAGSGVGVVGLCIATRVSGAEIVLVDNDPWLVDLASRNAERNGLTERVRAVAADISQGLAALRGPDRVPGLQAGAFDHVVSNPPYHVQGEGTEASLPFKAGAHQMPSAWLDGWLAFLHGAARDRGKLTMIHRTEALPRLLAAMDRRFGTIRVRPIQSRPTVPASRMLVTAIKGGAGPFELLPPLIVHNDDGTFRPEIAALSKQPTAVLP